MRRRRVWAIAAVVLAPLLIMAGPIAFGLVPLGFDAAPFYVPLLRLAAELVAAGESVVWTDRMGAGFPLVASMQADLLYPPTWLLLLADDPARWLALLLWLHLALLGVGGVRLGRAIGLSWLAACVIGVVLASAPSTMGLLNRPGFVWPLAWAPFTFAAALRRGRGRALEAGGSLGVAAMVSLQMAAAHLGIALALWALGRPRTVRGLARASLCFAALAAPAVVMFVELLPWSDRAAALLRSEALAQSIAPRQLLQLLSPGALGLGPAGLREVLGLVELSGATAAQVSWLSSPSPGVVALALALLGGITVRRLRPVLVLVVVLLALAMPWLPGVSLLWELPPLSLVRYPAKTWQAGLPLLVLLMGAGVDVVHRHRRLCAGLLASLMLAAGTMALLQASGADVAAGLLSLAFALLAVRHRRPARALAIVLTVEVLAWGSGSVDFASLPARADAPVAAQICAVFAEPHPRVTSLWDRGNPVLLGVSDRAARVELTARAAGGNAPLGQGLALDVAFTGIRLRGPHRLWSRSGDLGRLLRTLGARGALVGAGFAVPADLAVAARFPEEGVMLLVPAAPSPHVVVARRVLVVDEGAFEQALRSPEIDPALDAIVIGTHAVSFAGTGSARLLEHSATRTHLAVVAQGGDVLVWTKDALGPGWRVQVDGLAAEPVAVHGGLRGVLVPPGVHDVVWQHKSSSLWLGLAISGACLLALLASLLRRRAMARG